MCVCGLHVTLTLFLTGSIHTCAERTYCSLFSCLSIQTPRYVPIIAHHIQVWFSLGARIEALARAPLWSVGLDYKHGTGHGVGAFLNVHEGSAQSYPSRAHVIVTLWHQVPRASISVGQMRDCMQEWWSQMVSDEGVARW